jgi:hypothetical protein
VEYGIWLLHYKSLLLRIVEGSNMAALLQKHRWCSVRSPYLSGHIHTKGLKGWELLRCTGWIRVKTQENRSPAHFAEGGEGEKCDVYPMLSRESEWGVSVRNQKAASSSVDMPRMPNFREFPGWGVFAWWCLRSSPVIPCKPWQTP